MRRADRGTIEHTVRVIGETTVLIPACDEEPRLGSVLCGVREALGAVPVLVVDGGSVDGTVKLARAHGAEVILQEGSGYACALGTAYRLLARRGVCAVLQLDADGQHPTSAAPCLLEGLVGADIVVGSRLKHPLSARGIGNYLLRRALQARLGRQFLDATSGYWAVGPRAIALFASHFPADVADANIRALVIRAGLTLVERSVPMEPRRTGGSMHDGWRGLVNFHRSMAALAREA